MTWGDWFNSDQNDGMFIPTEDGLIRFAYPLDEDMMYYAVGIEGGDMDQIIPASFEHPVDTINEKMVIIMSASDLGLE